MRPNQICRPNPDNIKLIIFKQFYSDFFSGFNILSPNGTASVYLRMKVLKHTLCCRKTDSYVFVQVYFYDEVLDNYSFHIFSFVGSTLKQL